MEMNVKQRFGSKEIKRAIIIVLAMCAVMLLLAVGFLQFNKKLYGILLQRSMQQVDELSVYVEKNLQLKLEQDVNTLKLVQGQIENQADPMSFEAMEQLKTFCADSDFKVMGISDRNGKGRDVSGNEHDLQFENVLEQIEEDGIFISNVVHEKSETLLFFALPIIQQEEIRAILWGERSLADMVDSIEFNDGYKYFQIIDRQGKYQLLSRSKFALNEPEYLQTSLWEEMEGYQFKNGPSAQEIFQMVQNGESGNFFFACNDQGRYVSFRPLRINNWYLFSVQVEDELNDAVYQTRKVTGNFLLLISIGMIAVFGVLYGLIYFMYTKIAKQNREIQAINGMFKTTLQHTKSIPFVIDQKLRQIILYGYPYKDSIQCYSFEEVTPKVLIKKNLMEKECVAAYEKLYESLIVKKEKCEPTVICSHVWGKKQWIRVHITSDAENSADQVIGVMENYNEQKEKDLQIETQIHDMKKIEKKSQIDFLTGIYNREAFMEKVGAELGRYDENQKGALLLLDLDFFKEVNDRMGHGMGDEVLKTTAAALREFFRKDDIVGRLGGDEFVVFANNIKDVSLFEKRLEKLNEKLCRAYEKDGESVKVSASIGVVLADENNKDLPLLYEKADQALYKVKQSGRSDYQIYSDQ